jgi:hemoglobin
MNMTRKTLSSILAGAVLAFAALAPVHAADDATFRGLGGQPGIKKIVATLIPLVQADARIKESFADTDMKNLAMRLEEQFCALTGGPCVYKGEEMADVHRGLKVTNAQFNALAEDLQIAMERNGVPSHVQNKLVAKLASMQRTIVTK